MMNEHARKQSEYEIKVAGQLDGRWQEWFDGLTVSPGDDGNTVLRGPIRDQAALHGVLKKRSITLISLNFSEPRKFVAAFSGRVKTEMDIRGYKKNHLLRTKGDGNMSKLQKWGGIALYEALAYVIGFVGFIAVVNVGGIADPLEK
ncbi:MAG: hypothetical protein R3E31_17680 [Chloroflexota bacterium]